MNLIKYPNKILTEPTKEVTQEQLSEIMAYMPEFIKLMETEKGVGLAANQAGIGLSFATIDLTKDSWHDKSTDKTLILINPKIIDQKYPVRVKEGCLSLPGFNEIINRYAEVTVEYRDENWELKTKTIEGLMAQCAIHEVNHLNGKLAMHDVSPMVQQMYLKKLKKNGLL